MAEADDAAAARRRTVVTDYRNKLLNCRELETRVRTGNTAPPPPVPPLMLSGCLLDL
jgi:hypothetical protein